MFEHTRQKCLLPFGSSTLVDNSRTLINCRQRSKCHTNAACAVVIEVVAPSAVDGVPLARIRAHCVDA